jgi:hypothetical protein
MERRHIKCKRYNKFGHKAKGYPVIHCSECKGPHAWEACPIANCPNCPELPQGQLHWKRNCPKKETCYKCSGSHAAKYCKVPITRDMLARKRVLDGDTSAGASLTVPPSVPQDTTVEEGTLVENDEDLQMAIQRSLITSKTEDDRRLVQERYMAFVLKLTWEDKDFLIRFRDSLGERIEESSVDSDDLAKLDKTFQLFVVARDEYLKEAHGDKYTTVDTSSVS